MDLYIMADAMFDLWKIAAAENLVLAKKKMDNENSAYQLISIYQCTMYEKCMERDIFSW